MSRTCDLDRFGRRSAIIGGYLVFGLGTLATAPPARSWATMPLGRWIHFALLDVGEGEQ
jgi:MFS family permease